MKVILITGCSSGLGLALANELLLESKEHRIVVTARESSFATLQAKFKDSDRVMVRALDVTEPDQVNRLINEVCCKWGRIDTLVNNAAICYRSVVEHMDPEAELKQLKTNYLGPMNLIRTVLPVMREQGGGHIINVSSASAVVAMPTMGSYSASKHALEAASKALWYEAHPFGIHVSIVQPGMIHSAGAKNAVLSKKAHMSSQLGGPHAEYYASMVPFILRMMGWSRVTYQDVARKIIRLIESPKPKFYVVATPDAVLLKALKWFLPLGLFRALMLRVLPGSKCWGERRRSALTAARVFPVVPGT